MFLITLFKTNQNIHSFPDAHSTPPLNGRSKNHHHQHRQRASSSTAPLISHTQQGIDAAAAMNRRPNGQAARHQKTWTDYLPDFVKRGSRQVGNIPKFSFTVNDSGSQGVSWVFLVEEKEIF